MYRLKTIVPLALAFALVSGAVSASPLTEAKINKIINDVSVVDPSKGTRKASLQEIIKDDVGVKTGIKSRSELLFQDETLTRIGPESYFSFKPGTRDMALEKGTMLLQVPKGLGGAKIRAAAVTAAITGTTIMLENIPGRHLKFLVLEGSLRLSMNGTFGDSLLLLPGKMVIMPPDAKRIPEPVSVDIARIMNTSSLVKMGPAEKPLPSVPLIQNEIQIQAKNKSGNTLVDTNLVILGGGTRVVAASDVVLDALSRKDSLGDIILAANDVPTRAPTPAPVATPATTPVALPLPTPVATATPPPSPTPGASATPTPGASATPTPGPSATPTPAPSATPTPGPSATPTPEPSATPTPGPSATPTPGPSATPTPSATPQPTPAGSPIVISNPGDVTITTPIAASSVDITAGGKLDVAATIDAGDLVFDAGKDSKIDARITATTVTGKVVGDLEVKSAIDADVITLDVTKSLKYTVTLVAPVAGGALLTAPSDGRKLTVYADSFDIKSTNPNNAAPITLNGGNAATLSLFAGGNGGTLDVGTAARPIQGPIDVAAPIMATTGQNGTTVAYGGDGGTVGLVSDEKIIVSSQIKVSDTAAGRASRKGGNITLDSRNTSGTAIDVTSSAQLLSLLGNSAAGPGGMIKFTSAGGDINISGTTKADRGTVDIRNTGNGGLITLKNATLHGDVVKAGALGDNGTLNIDGGNLSADSTIKLYAGGSNGTVNFKDNVTLSGTSVKTISGHTVTISDGKIVTVNGPAPAQVFTNNPNYTGSGGNNSTSGAFGGKGATTQPLSGGPGY